MVTCSDAWRHTVLPCVHGVHVFVAVLWGQTQMLGEKQPSCCELHEYCPPGEGGDLSPHAYEPLCFGAAQTHREWTKTEDRILFCIQLYYNYIKNVSTETSSHQNSLPQQQQHLLHWEMRGMTTAELGHHTEEHDRNWLIVEKGRSWVKEGSGNNLVSIFLYISMIWMLIKPTNFCSECFPNDFPFRLVGWVIVLYSFHH